MNSSVPSQMEQLSDFAKQLKRHTKGRRAVHIQMSRLLKHHQEAAFRREASAFLKPIIDKFSGSRNFVLSNHDLMLVTHGAQLDDIEVALAKIRKQFKEDPLILSLDPVQGKSDNYTVWYDLEKEFADFSASVGLMFKAEKAGKAMTETFVSKAPAKNKPVNSNVAERGYSKPAKPAYNVRAVKIGRTDSGADVPSVTLDAETILKLEKFIKVMDLSAYVRSGDIMAIVGKDKPVTAMVERSAKVAEVIAPLIKGVDLRSNVWLKGYLEDLIAERMVVCEPELQNSSGLASMVKLTINSILGPNFSTFVQGHKKLDKSAIILEISMMDLLANSTRYEAAQARVRQAGYKLAIGQIDPLALTILDTSILDVDFFKVTWRPAIKEWLRGSNLEKFTKALHRIGLPRVIIAHCSSVDAISTMRSLGALLFEGSAAAGYKPD